MIRTLRKLFYAVLFLALLVVGLTFAARNPQTAHVSWYFGIDHELPLALLLFGSLTAGLVLGYLLAVLRRRRRPDARATTGSPGTGLVASGKG